MDFLLISIETPVLATLAQFWNSAFKCFELPNLDLVATIEEYRAMLRLPTKEKVAIYLYRGSYVGERKIAKTIILLTNLAKFESRGSIQGWNQTLLTDHF